jgi:hypothetical protein
MQEMFRARQIDPNSPQALDMWSRVFQTQVALALVLVGAYQAIQKEHVTRQAVLDQARENYEQMLKDAGFESQVQIVGAVLNEGRAANQIAATEDVAPSVCLMCTENVVTAGIAALSKVRDKQRARSLWWVTKGL